MNAKRAKVYRVSTTGDMPKLKKTVALVKTFKDYCPRYAKYVTEPIISQNEVRFNVTNHLAMFNLLAFEQYEEAIHKLSDIIPGEFELACAHSQFDVNEI